MIPVLENIFREKRSELEAVMRRVPPGRLQGMPLYGEPRRGFAAALVNAPGPAVIAELKKASPSKGLLRADFDLEALVRAYTANGAAAVSVLTEKNFFLGSIDNLSRARSLTHLPLLRKDFLFDPYQLHEARAYGADCVLLIAAMLDAALIEDLDAAARALGLDTLIEVHDHDDLEKIRNCAPSVVGVNNRNLKTMETDMQTSVRLSRDMPAETCKISESGIKNNAGIRMLRDAGYAGFLIGESLVTAADPGAALRALIGK
jgi:indole-3-glycerol phosphate synthase